MIENTTLKDIICFAFEDAQSTVVRFNKSVSKQKQDPPSESCLMRGGRVGRKLRNFDTEGEHQCTDLFTKAAVRADKFAEVRRPFGIYIQSLVPWIRAAAVGPRLLVACVALPSMCCHARSHPDRHAEPLPG